MAYRQNFTKSKDISSLRFVQFVFKVILFLSGVNTTVIGLENIPKDEPVVFIGNHRGFLTRLYLTAACRVLQVLLPKRDAKSSIYKIMDEIFTLPFMDRSNPREGLKTILSGIEQINNGISIVIFPEGTRNKGDGIMPFHGGSFKLADKSNCKIIPMVQNNTENVLEAHFPSIKRTHTVLEFGTPIDTAALDRDERKALPDTVHDLMLQIYEKNKSLV